MEFLNTYKVKNAKVYRLLKEKNDIVMAGRKLTKKIEPLEKKLKPLMEELSKLEKQLLNKEDKIMVAVEDSVKSVRDKFGEWEELHQFSNSKTENIIELKTVDVLKQREQELENFKKEYKK